MTRPLEYLRDGFDPAGPKRIRCRHCGRIVNSNAFARFSHRTTCPVHCPDCSRTIPHVHCPECGSTEHVAEDCDMEG
jgi:RNA polymerase subunit RPABC4/transcription elongation factor Spt4